MMNDTIRELLYPFGFLSSICFGLRFFVQWLKSEKQGACVTPRVFWRLSVTGNVLLLIHSIIQVHFPMSLCQSIHAVLGYRNLNLMQKKRKPLSFQTTIFLLAVAILFISVLFFLQGEWILPPSLHFGALRSDCTFWMHGIGSIGILCYSIRFWIQWWYVEKAALFTFSASFRPPARESSVAFFSSAIASAIASSKTTTSDPSRLAEILPAKVNKAEKSRDTVLPECFWWLSLAGSCLSVSYFYYLGDLVNVIGPLISFVPYSRNLMLLCKRRYAS